jgi:hypothetical protein
VKDKGSVFVGNEMVCTVFSFLVVFSLRYKELSTGTDSKLKLNQETFPYSVLFV